MNRRKGTKPEQYAGVFQQYEDVPERYRLATFAQQYQGEDTWQQYRDEVLLAEQDGQHVRRTARIAGNSWSDHMDERGRHHALATPTDVKAWCEKLVDGDRCRRTCYEHYFVRIYQFYDHLTASYRHPHLYNTLLMAAIEHETPRDLWMYRVDRRPEVVARV